jgi:hypothetical protein
MMQRGNGLGVEAMLIFHYTNTSGLLGIVRQRALWATDAEYLNDSKELRHGREEVVAVLRSAASRLMHEEGAAEGSTTLSRAEVMLTAASSLEREEHRSYWGPYVACFCESGDLLSQWRAYAEGGGWALGFDSSLLPARVIEVDDDVEMLEKVRYGKAGIDQAVERVMARIAPGPSAHPGTHGDYRAHVVCRRELACAKDGAFEEEREWRLIIEQESEHQRLAFRAGHLGLTPYVSVDWPSAALRRVIAGPGAHMELRTSAAKRMLQDEGLGQVDVGPSEAPFR